MGTVGCEGETELILEVELLPRLAGWAVLCARDGLFFTWLPVRLEGEEEEGLSAFRLPLL